MSTTYRDTWLKLRKVHRTEKIRKTITIPAFEVDCGPVKSSLTSGVLQHVAPSMTAFLDAVTIECWVKFVSRQSFSHTLFSRFDTISEINQYHLNVQADGTVGCSFRKGGAYVTATSTTAISVGEWNFISATWDGTTIRLFINGIEAGGSVAMAAPIDVLGGNIRHHMSTNPLIYTDEIRLWNEGRAGVLYHDGTNANVSDKIKNSMFAPRSTVAADSIDDTLKAYYKMDSMVESISGEAIAFGVPAGQYITTESAPLKYGASFVCNKFTVAHTERSSLIYPIQGVPDDIDFMLCVAWTDDDGNTQRRRLWDMDGVDINPMPAAYRGETLPATYYLEVWNIDGNATATLSEDITIQSSVTSDPTNGADRTPTALLTPTQSSALADPFPLGLPGAYDTQQTY
jgi:hypothetical protein